MYTQHKEPSYSVVETHVQFVDDLGNEHIARDYQKEAVLAMHAKRSVLLMHAKRSSILKFQKAVVQLQKECDKWKQGGFDFSMNISLPIKQAIVTDDYRFSLSVQEDQQVDDSEIEYGGGQQWFDRKTFYTMTREDKSTATLIVIEKISKISYKEKLKRTNPVRSPQASGNPDRSPQASGRM